MEEYLGICSYLCSVVYSQNWSHQAESFVLTPSKIKKKKIHVFTISKEWKSPFVKHLLSLNAICYNLLLNGI